VIILDTHSWIWWVGSPKKLSTRARKACASAEVLLVAAISCWEVAMLVAHGRIGFDRDVDLWIKHALVVPGIRLEPLTPTIAVRSTRLPGAAPKDPADRMIAATALEYGIPLVTRDRELKGYPHIRTIW
jgi:PIN domain nuclease of toxin-antitoxin system